MVLLVMTTGKDTIPAGTTLTQSSSQLVIPWAPPTAFGTFVKDN